MKNIIIPLVAFLLSTCTSKEGNDVSSSGRSNVAQFPNVVMYEIFVQSFADSDGDGIGDINGMTEKLDYLQELGIKGIWLMPIMPSPSYHKYDVTDYYDIHPEYGTMEDFKRFLDEAYKRDIKVVIDMIINHTSNQHPWFLEALTGKNAEFRDYYVWMSDEEITQFSSMQKEVTGDSYNITQWHEAEGNEEKFYGFFTGMMPDLNFDNHEVRERVMELADFWMNEIGVDGFRLDAARHIYEDSRAVDNQNWWRDYRGALQQAEPDFYLVGEVWGRTQDTAPFLHGLPALFNFDLAFSILESIKREKSVSAFISGHAWEVDESTSFERGYLKNQEVYINETSDFTDAIFLSNHDQNRILSVLDGDIRKGKLAASILLTMPGTPYIYYGEEIGMLGMKPDPNIREPFLWDRQKNDLYRTTWIEPQFTTEGRVVPLAEQVKDSSTIFNHYRSLIHTRNQSTALTYGLLQNADYSQGDLIAYYRKSTDQTLLIIHNLTERVASIQLKAEDTRFDNTVYTSHGEQLANGGIDLEPFSTIILSE
jgi:glycosidase